ncbi:alpha/beta-hydrolase [Peniophora sp. CONT]|nr:alpha/beta-hydrolase [Peniophora sp. CONT]
MVHKTWLTAITWMAAARHAQSASLPTIPANNRTIIDLGYAKYQSDVVYDDDVLSFLGIRYAAPPVGDLRWRSPQPPAQIEGVQNATAQPPQCMQAPGVVGFPGMSLTNPFRKRDVANTAFEQPPTTSDEDCLFLNVHTPSNFHSQSALPVVVWIHGGAYDAANASTYPAQDWVQQTDGGLVAVQVQYRLGPFGFLSSEAIKGDGDLNVGLLDQQYALQWVQKNIAAFGGDPDQVTIWGQSAGAGSVLQHIIANGGHTQPPLFRGAIMESPFLPFQYQYNDPTPETLFSQVLSIAGCNATEPNGALKCLRDADASLILKADMTLGFASFMMTWPFVPVIDGDFIRERPAEALAGRKINGEALYVNTNSHEGSIFVNGSALEAANYTLSDYIRELFPRITPSDVDAVASAYAADPALNTLADQAAGVIGENILICPAYYALDAFGSKGYKSEYALPPAAHADELSYIFTNYEVPQSFPNPEFQQAFSSAFLSTAMSLRPSMTLNATGPDEAWPAWVNGHTEMLFNKTEGNAPDLRVFETDPTLLRRCALWRALSAAIEQ